MKLAALLPPGLALAGSLLCCGASPPVLEGVGEGLRPPSPGFHRQAMRELVQQLGAYARRSNPGFIVVPQNGLGLLTEDGTPEGAVVEPYLRAVDGVGQEELFYGYPRFGQPTPTESTRYLLDFLRLARVRDKTVMVIDYCRRPEAVADSDARSAGEGFLSFAAPRRELDVIPSHPRPTANPGDVLQLSQARNFLYLINPGSFAGPRVFVKELGATSYDLLVVDAFVGDERRETRWLTAAEVGSLQRKPSGRKRLVLAYLSIGEAESYRYYWHREWDRLGDGVPDAGAPAWLEGENPQWRGNYKVRYWDPGWRSILYGRSDAYLDGIISRGFDGVYLDLVDAYLYFEAQLESLH